MLDAAWTGVALTRHIVVSLCMEWARGEEGGTHHSMIGHTLYSFGCPHPTPLLLTLYLFMGVTTHDFILHVLCMLHNAFIGTRA